MAKSKHDKVVSSLEMTFQVARSLSIANPKTVQIDNRLINKIKSVAIDFPELNLTQTKLVNAIVMDWLDRHRNELINNHIKNASDRF